MLNNLQKKVHYRKVIQPALFCITLGICVSSFLSLKAQVATYSFSSSTGTYTSVAGNTLFSNPWDDELSSLLNIPFTFTYNNIAYTTVGVSANGFITLGAVPSSATVYCGLQASDNNSIAGYGTDLVSAGSGSTVNYMTRGTTPNREFVIQWTDCDHFNNGSSNHLSFQIILKETSNTVNVVWGNSSLATTLGPNSCQDNPDESGNVGLLGSSVSDFNVRSITNGINTWPTSIAGTSLSDVCNMSSSNLPLIGLTYTWTPVPPSPMSFVSCTTTFINNLLEVGVNASTKILQVKVVTTGTLSPIQVTGLTLNTNGCTNATTDILNSKIYFTGNSSSFTSATPFGSAFNNPNGSYTINGSATLSFGTNYFWIEYKIKSNAVIGDTLSGCCTQVTGSGTIGTQVPSITCPAGYQLIAELGYWTPLVNLAPDQNGGVMILLSDGTVMAKTFTGGIDSMGTYWDRLTPDIHGSYVNGTWTTLAPMNDSRLYFSSQVLKDGRVYVAGGEYGTGGGLGETYDPLTDTWTMAPAQGQNISDANSEILPDGKVLQALVNTSNPTSIDIFDPVTNTYINGPACIGSHNESTWVKLPDNSILMVDLSSTNSERYIPSLNQWIADANVPVQLYDQFGQETGAGLLLPDGQAFFIGATGHTAYYLPSGNTNPGVWIAGPDVPGNLGAPDAPAAMMVNGKILCAMAPAPTSFGTIFITPTSFFEFNYLTNSFTSISAPDGNDTLSIACYQTNMLVLPDGNILYSNQQDTATGLQYYIYTPSGSPLGSGKPTIGNVIPNGCNSFTLTGTLFNGISEGAAYGDDWQMATNYPIVRLSAGGNVYYARTFNWNRTSVMTGNLADTTEFTLPAGLPAGSYWLVVVANGIASDSVLFTPPVLPSLSSTLTPPAICNNTAFTYLPSSTDTNATFTWTRPAVTGISNAAVTVPQALNPNEILVNTTSNPVNVVYHYTISSNGCINTQLVTVTVNAATTISGPQALCLGDSITLTAGGGTGFAWSTGATTTSITVSPSTPATYYVIPTNVTGCVDTAFKSIVIHQLPNPSVTASDSISFCQGGFVILSTGNYAAYTWSNGSSNDSITVTASGTYVVTVTNGNGCSGSDSLTVEVNPLPTVSFTGLPDTVCTYHANSTLTGNPAGGIFTGPGISGNIFHPATAPVGNSTIIYSYTDSLGCSNSYTQEVYVSLCLGIAESGNLNNVIHVYPNPAGKEAWISFETKNEVHYIITLDDLTGRTILEKENYSIRGTNTLKLNLEKISKGVYVINFQLKDWSIKSKLMIE